MKSLIKHSTRPAAVLKLFPARYTDLFLSIDRYSAKWADHDVFCCEISTFSAQNEGIIKMSDDDDSSIVPDHRDVSRALGAVLASFRRQDDVLSVLASQCVSARDLARFIAALLSAFAAHVARKVEDPESYLLQWIALELELADADERDDDSDE